MSSQTRMDLVAVLRQQPGLRIQELASALGVAWTTAEFHARQLERTEELRVIRFGSQKFLVPKEQRTQDALAAALMRRPAVVAVLDAIAPGPLVVSAVAERCGQAADTVRRSLAALESVALAVQTEPMPGRPRSYTLTQDGHAVLSATRGAHLHAVSVSSAAATVA